MPNSRLRAFTQADAYTSPWTVRHRLGYLLWIVVSRMFFHPTPKLFYPWRVFLLKCFGAKVTGTPFVAASAIVRYPWLLTLEDRACLADKSECYNLARITIKARATVAQQAYLCAGTHDFSDPRLPLVVGEIVVGEDVFIGARAFVMPGVEIGAGAILGACAVATKDLEAWMIYAGNPAKAVRKREMKVGPAVAS
ncbi:MAG TPA: DapH/DapD/GlmU-related protein [Phycisphaerae bacterium]|nr:DapH/DapD/GlmU-related protein [Phycisphaerae bacterium]